MKKFYSLMVLAIMALVSFSANAQVSFVVEVTNQDDVEVTYNPGSGYVPVEFVDNQAELTYPQSTTYFTLYVTPKDDIIYKGYYLYDSEDYEMKHVSKNKTSKDAITIFLSQTPIDGGRIVIETASNTEDASLDVTVIGDPLKVDFSFIPKREVALEEGTQTIKFYSATERTVYISPVGVTTLYKVELNGSTLNPTQTSDESGHIAYQYSITPHNGDKIRIETDFPDIDYHVTIATSTPECVKAVTIDGSPIESWQSFDAHIGSTLQVVCDNYNYSLSGFTVNGEAVNNFVSSYSKIILGDIDITVDGEFIERPYLAKVYFDGNADWGFFGDNNSHPQLDTAAGYADLHFCADENPFKIQQFGVLNQSVGDDWTAFTYLNDYPLGGGNITVALNDGDVVKLFYSKNAPEKYSVSYSAEGIEPVIVKDHITSVDHTVGHESLVGSHVRISAPEGFAISHVSVNGQPLDAEDDGSYAFAVKGNSTVSVKGVTTGITNVDIEAALSGRVYNLQGVLLNTVGRTDYLPAGIYIVSGKKILVK